MRFFVQKRGEDRPSPRLSSGLPAGWDAPLGPLSQRSAGPPFSAMRKRGKNRQRRGLPPPCGIHPAVLGGECAFLCSALGPMGAHGLHGTSTESAYFCGTIVLLPPGPYPGEPLFPAIGSLADGGGNTAPPEEARRWKPPSHRASCPGGLVWWHKQGPQQE